MSGRALSGPKCKSCGAPVFFATTHRGNTAIFDAQPSPKGTRVRAILDGVVTMLPTAHPLAAIGPNTPLYLDHHATCPMAARYRKSRTASAPGVAL